MKNHSNVMFGMETTEENMALRGLWVLSMNEFGAGLKMSLLPEEGK